MYEGDPPRGGYWLNIGATATVRLGDRCATVEVGIGCWGGGWAATSASEWGSRAKVEHRGVLDRSDWEFCFCDDVDYNARYEMAEAIMDDPDAAAIIRDALGREPDLDDWDFCGELSFHFDAVPIDPPDLETLFNDAVSVGDARDYGEGVSVQPYGVADIEVYLVEVPMREICLFERREEADHWARKLADARRIYRKEMDELLDSFDDEDGSVLLDEDFVDDA
jgi:hypothetical protein